MRDRAIAVGVGLFFFFAGLAGAQAPGYVSPNDLGVIVGPPHNGRGVRAGLAWGKELQPSARYSTAMNNLRYAMAKWTRVPFEVDQKVRFESPVTGVDILFMSSDRSYQLTAEEKQNLKQYVEDGGILVVDSNGENLTLRHLIWELAGARMRDNGEIYDYFEAVPAEHPIYNTPFPISEAPEGIIARRVSTVMYYVREGTFVSMAGPPKLDGVFRDGRLAILYSTRGYMQTWVNPEKESEFEFGVNLIMYALAMNN